MVRNANRIAFIRFHEETKSQHCKNLSDDEIKVGVIHPIGIKSEHDQFVIEILCEWICILSGDCEPNEQYWNEQYEQYWIQRFLLV